jgi:hypothetical protein
MNELACALFISMRADLPPSNSETEEVWAQSVVDLASRLSQKCQATHTVARRLGLDRDAVTTIQRALSYLRSAAARRAEGIAECKKTGRPKITPDEHSWLEGMCRAYAQLFGRPPGIQDSGPGARFIAGAAALLYEEWHARFPTQDGPLGRLSNAKTIASRLKELGPEGRGATTGAPDANVGIK